MAFQFSIFPTYLRFKMNLKKERGGDNLKKILLVLALALVVGLSASFSYAELLKVSDTEQKN